MSAGERGCVKLRRTVAATVFGRSFGFLLLFAAGLAFAAGVLVDGAGGAVVIALVCFAGWGFEFARSLRLCSDALVVRSLVFGGRRFLVKDIVLVEVGRYLGGSGYGSYSGVVLVVETRSDRRVVEPSRYCGRRRLSEWADAIERHRDFGGVVKCGSKRLARIDVAGST